MQLTLCTGRLEHTVRAAPTTPRTMSGIVRTPRVRAPARSRRLHSTRLRIAAGLAITGQHVRLTTRDERLTSDRKMDSSRNTELARGEARRSSEADRWDEWDSWDSPGTSLRKAPGLWLIPSIPSNPIKSHQSALLGKRPTFQARRISTAPLKLDSRNRDQPEIYSRAVRDRAQASLAPHAANRPSRD
jgi:hypothetical protein